MTSRCVLALAWCLFFFILQAARARLVTVDHSDTAQIEYFPLVCLGRDIECNDGCDHWWVSKSSCFKNGASSAHSTKLPGSSLRFNFTGSEISLVVNARKKGARAILELDGVHEAEVSTIAEHQTPNSVVWRKTGLAYSPHSLVLTYDPTSFDPTGDDQFLHIVGFTYDIPEDTPLGGTPSATNPNQMPVATTESSNSAVASASPNLIGIIVGVIGGVGLLIALIIGFYFGRRWDRQRKLQNSTLPTVAPAQAPPPVPRGHIAPYMYREQPMQPMPIQPTFLHEPPPPRYPRRWTTMSDLSSAVSIGRTDITSVYYDEKSPLKAQFYDDRQRSGSPPPDGTL